MVTEAFGSALLKRLAEIGFDPRATADAPRLALAHCAREMGCSFGVLWLRDTAAGRLRVMETYGGPQALKLEDIEAARLSEFEGGRALDLGRPVLIGDAEAVALAPGSAELIRHLRALRVEIRALAIAPLMARGEARGIVTFCWPDPVHWQSGDVEFFSTLATIMAMVVENANLRSQLECRVDELHALLHIASAASASLDMDTVFPRVLPKVRHLLKADQVGVALLSEDGRELVPTRYLEGYDLARNSLPPEALLLSKKPWVQEALRSSAPLFVPDYLSDPRIGEEERRAFATGSAAAVPLMAGERHLGVMFVNWHAGLDALPETQMQLLEVIGRQLGRFLANAAVHADVQLQNRYLKAATHVALALASSLPLKELLREICRQIVQALGAALSEIFLIDSSGEYLEGAAIYGPWVTSDDMRYFEAERHPLMSPLLISSSVREGRTVAIPDARHDPRITGEWARRHRIGPTLFLPLRKVSGERLGVMTLAKVAGQPPFTDGELTMAEVVARQASVAIERTMLYAEQGRAMSAVAGLAWLNYWRAAEFDALIRNLTDGVIVLRASGEVDTVNRAALEALGVEDEGKVIQLLSQVRLFDLRGKPIEDGLDPLSRVLRGETFRNYVVSAFLRQGQRFLSFSGTKVTLEDGRVGLAVLTVNDVTDQHKLEAARSEFISDLFHDMVTPVTVIMLAAQNALKRLSKGYSTEQVVRNLGTIVNRSEDLVKMLRLLIDASKLDADILRVYPEWFDISQALKDWVEEMVVGWPEHPIVARIQDGVRVYADPEAVRRVLDNVVSNAVRHSPAGSSIYLCLAAEEQWAYLAVRDQGVGIPVEHQARVFERYFSGKPSGARMGVGLYLSRKLLEAQGGQIWLTSLPGQGTTVFISLPTAMPASP